MNDIMHDGISFIKNKTEKMLNMKKIHELEIEEENKILWLNCSLYYFPFNILFTSRFKIKCSKLVNFYKLYPTAYVPYSVILLSE